MVEFQRNPLRTPLQYSYLEIQNIVKSAIDLIRIPAGFIIAIKEVFFPELFCVSVESTAHPAGVLSGSTTQQRAQHPSLGFSSESGRPVGIK